MLIPGLTVRVTEVEVPLLTTFVMSPIGIQTFDAGVGKGRTAGITCDDAQEPLTQFGSLILVTCTQSPPAALLFITGVCTAVAIVEARVASSLLTWVWIAFPSTADEPWQFWQMVRSV